MNRLQNADVKNVLNDPHRGHDEPFSQRISQSPAISLRDSSNKFAAVLLALGFASIIAPGLSAQTTAVDASRVDRALNLQAEERTIRAGGLFAPTEEDFSDDLSAPVSPGDDDMGIQLLLKEEKDLKFWNVYGSVDGTYTTNAPLIRSPQLDDAFMSSTFGVQYTRPLSSQWSISAGVNQQFVRYDELTFLDFDAFQGNASVNYFEPRLWDLSFHLRYNYDRLMTATLDGVFYQSHTLTFGAQKFIPLARAHYLYFGADAEWGWGEPAAPQRDEYVAYGGYNVNLARYLQAQVFYRGGLYTYNFVNRNDYNQIVGLAVAWSLNDWAVLAFQLSHNLNRSDRSVFDYGAFNVGGGLRLSLQF